MLEPNFEKADGLGISYQKLEQNPNQIREVMKYVLISNFGTKNLGPSDWPRE